MFSFQDRRGSVEVAFTDRFGGMSHGPFAELNLRPPDTEAALVHGENEDTVSENWDIVAYAMDRGGAAPGDNYLELAGGATVKGLTHMHQVHGAEVALVGDDPVQREPTGDGVVTRTPGWILAPRAADCVPVLIADPDRGVVGAAHAGRKGLVAGVVPETIAAMRKLGAERLVAWVGPHACGRCYEVPADMRQAVADAIPQSWGETSWGTPSVDLGAGISAQLEAEGAETVRVGGCTIEDDRYYSYRRDGRDTGRQAGLVWIRP